MRLCPKRIRAFTLIELLVVISIVAILMGLAFPGFPRRAEYRQENAGEERPRPNRDRGECVLYRVREVSATAGRRQTMVHVCGPSDQSSELLFDALRGVSCDDATQSPDRSYSLILPTQKTSRTPRGGIRTTAMTSFMILGESLTRSAMTPITTTRCRTRILRTRVPAANVAAGRDRVVAWKGSEPAAADDKNSADSKDDVISWQ